jgi:hypothetical protein
MLIISVNLVSRTRRRERSSRSFAILTRAITTRHPEHGLCRRPVVRRAQTARVDTDRSLYARMLWLSGSTKASAANTWLMWSPPLARNVAHHVEFRSITGQNLYRRFSTTGPMSNMSNWHSHVLANRPTTRSSKVSMASRGRSV